MAPERWHLKGDYFENCNCAILCPCIVRGRDAVPTEGHCDLALAFHVEEGDFDGVPLAGLSFVVAIYTPAAMAVGNWSTAIYIDEAADEAQRRALGRILSGEVGGPMERWMGLTGSFLGVKYAPITYSIQGHARSVTIPDILDLNVEGLMAGRRATEPMRLENTNHPVSPSLVLARGTRASYTDHGMSWDNTGKNGHYAPFQWSWP